MATNETLDDIEMGWREAALRIGEDLGSTGPDGYYDMTPENWLYWAIGQIRKGGRPNIPPIAWIHYNQWDKLVNDGENEIVIQRQPTPEIAGEYIPLFGSVEWGEQQGEETNVDV